MKLQLKNANQVFQDNTFGDLLYDPVSVKKLTKEEKEFYQSFKITHEMDMRSFLMLGEMFLLKYMVGEPMSFSKEREKDIFVSDYNLLKDLQGETVNAFNVWTENINQRNSKEAYVKCFEFLQNEVPILNYHFYNMAFSRLNATNIDNWKESYYLMEPYMKAVQDFKERMKDMIEKITYRYMLEKESYTSFVLDGNPKSKETSFFRKIYNSAYSEKNNVFWDKNRKKEERFHIQDSALDFFKENMMLVNFHFSKYKNLHKRYTVSALKSIRENKDNLQFSLIDEVENLNYNQFFFEALLARSLSDSFDSIEHTDINVLREYGVHGYELKRRAIQLLDTRKLELYKNKGGGSKMYANFEKNYRELCLNKKIEQMEVEKEQIGKKKKI